MIKFEMKNYNMISTEKQQKYQHYHPENLKNMSTLQVKKYCLSYQRIVTEQAKFSYSSLGKALDLKSKQKQLKNKEKTNRCYYRSKQKTKALNNIDDHKSIYKEIFNRIVKERFDERKESTHELDHDNLIFHFKNNTAKKL